MGAPSLLPSAPFPTLCGFQAPHQGLGHIPYASLAFLSQISGLQDSFTSVAQRSFSVERSIPGFISPDALCSQVVCCSVDKSCQIFCDPHELHHIRLPCPSLSPRVCLNSCPLRWWCLAFLPRSKRLLISWLQSSSKVILEPKKRKSVTVSTFFPSICHEVMGPGHDLSFLNVEF